MKLLRFGNAGEEKPGLIDQSGKIRDLSSVIDDINSNTIAPWRNSLVQAKKATARYAATVDILVHAVARLRRPNGDGPLYTAEHSFSIRIQ